MGKVNSGWVRRRAAVLLSATLALSPVMAVPAMAVESGDDATAVEATAEKDVERVDEVTEPVESEEGPEAAGTEAASEPDAPAATTSDEVAPQAEGAIMFNGEAYETLTAAFQAAVNGGTITLTDDVTVLKMSDADANGLTGDVTLDLGGHTVYGANNNIAIRAKGSSGTLTITNGSIVAKLGTYCTVCVTDATLTLDGVTLHNETQYGMSVKAFEGGRAILKNCTSTSTNGSGAITAAGGTVDVYGGKYTQEGYYDHNSSLLAPSGGTGVINVYGGTFTAQGSGIYVFSSGGTVNFYDGNLSVTGQYPAVRGDIDSGSYPTALGSINVYGGSIAGAFQNINQNVDVKVSGGTFTSETVEGYLAPGFVYEAGAVAKNENAVVTVANADGTVVGAYESLQEAVNEVPAGGTVALTDNLTGNGVKVDGNKEFTLDLGGFTYTVDGGLVGSTGTETNGFQLLQGNDITIKNGRISSDKALILIQNYSDLTLEDVTLDGGKLTQYTLSNNNGDVLIGAGTNIYAGDAQPGVAFDVCRFSSYPSVHVTVDEGAGEIVGVIELSASNNDAKDGLSLTINGGDLSEAQIGVVAGGDLTTVTKAPTVSLPAPKGYQWVDGELRKASDPAVKTVASITDEAGNVTYFSTLSDAVSAATEGQTIALLGNVTESVTIPADKSVTLDLAGHTLTNADGKHTVTVAKGGTLTVTDSSADKTGTIDNVSHGKGALVNYGTVTVNGGTLTRSAEASKSPTDNGGNSWYVVDNQGTMTFNGGKVVNDGYFSSLVRNAAGALTINDGTFENHFIAIKNEDATLYVKGGTITSDEQSLQNWGTATLSGGILNGRVAAWDQNDDMHSLTTIEGDVTINGDVQAINYLNAEEGPEVVITGGTITGKVQKATHDGTGTKPVDPTFDKSTIAISGGTFASPVDDALIVPGSGLNKNEDGTYGVHEHELEAVAEVAPTCDKDGNKAHWRCGVCGDLFADEAMTQPVAAEDVVLPATHHANATHVKAVEPTETTAGNYEYWHCPDCGRYFADAALTQETTLAALTRPALGQEPVETHTVTFDFGTGEPSRTVTVADGEAVPRPDDPVFEGWTFAGWFTDKGTFQDAYDFSTPVTGDLTLYAGWYEAEAEEGAKPSTPTTETGERSEAGDALANTGDATSVAAPIAAAVLGVSAVAAGALSRRRREE